MCCRYGEITLVHLNKLALKNMPLNLQELKSNQKSMSPTKFILSAFKSIYNIVELVIVFIIVLLLYEIIILALLFYCPQQIFHKF